MPEPTTSTAMAAAVTYAGTSITVPLLSVFGVSLGLRTDLLIAGFFGSLVGIILLNAVPSSGDTWRHLLRTTGRRMAFSLASSLVAGYLTPLELLLATLPPSMVALVAFVIGTGAQRFLAFVIGKMGVPPEVAPKEGVGQ
jgi:hypothetical protein